MIVAAALAIATTPQATPETYRVSVQAWTFNRFSAFEAVEKSAAAGAKYIEFFPGQRVGGGFENVQMGPGMTPDSLAGLKAHLKKHNILPLAFGVTSISRDPAQARILFAWAKGMGIEVINTESTDAIDTVEAMVKEFDMKVGYHNHPQTNDPNYKVWNPAYVYDLVKNRDKRVGACADTGHWVRSGIKPVDAIKTLKGRVVSSHLKDLHEFTRGGHDVPYGTGVSNVPGILSEYRKIKFTGPISVEYEYNWDSSLPEVAQCVGYVRGYAGK